MGETAGPRPERSQVDSASLAVLGCKWSAAILRTIRSGVVRPGGIGRAIPGLSTKVLNERLAKLVRLGFMSRHAYPEIPPRVEYHLTRAGERLARILDEIEALDAELRGDESEAG